jgi:alpha-galactosidase
MRKYIIILLMLSVQISLCQTFKELAKTPPMGWNSWNRFGCNVSEQLIKEIADAMVASGMKDAGYQYIVIDDCWQVSRDAEGTIVADPERFPSGIEALAEYIHNLGLKFGLYSCAGTETCAGRPGSKGYEAKDAETYAAWKVDYLKYDWCNTTGQNTQTSYKLMSDALQATGRPIVFSICEWGSTQPWLWAQGIGHLWRTTGDIQANWNSIMDILDRQVGLEQYAGPGGWNDPDMLEVGNGNLTLGEYRAHFSLWCLLAAPLMSGNDLRTMTGDIIDIMTNKEVLAVNQDSLGVQGYKMQDDGDYEVWIKPMQDSSFAVILLNRSQIEKQMSIYWEKIGFSSDDILFVRDLWQKQDVGYLQTFYSSMVPAHDIVMIRISQKTPPGAIPNVSFTMPTDSSRFSVTNEIQFKVAATDADGEIVQVVFTANGEVIGTDSDQSDGWSLSWQAHRPGIYQIQAFATDNTAISASSQPLCLYLEPDAGPYYGSPVNIPAILEAEEYDGGGEGIGFHDSDDINQGGAYRWDGVDIGLSSGENSTYYVGWFETGEWLKYTIAIPETESYDFFLTSASTTGTGKCTLELDGNDLAGPIAISLTGGEYLWKDQLLPDLNLPAGVHELKLLIIEQGFNLNNLEIDYALKALPAPWKYQDIGQTAAKGNVGVRKNKYIVNASGADIWNSSDEFGYVYQQLQGDGEISTQVLSLEDTDPWSKAGVMMRNTLTASSMHCMAIVSAANGIAFQRRTVTGSSSTHTAGSPVQAPYWVKLTRVRDRFTGYESQDGLSWQRIGAESISMNEIIYVGLAVTAHNDGLICEAQFNNVEIKGTIASVLPDRSDTIEKFKLYPLFPNPFNSSLSIVYDLQCDTEVAITIYDLLGKKVRLLERVAKKAGQYHTIWDARDGSGMMVASGIYLCEVHADNKTEIKKALFLK